MSYLDRVNDGDQRIGDEGPARLVTLSAEEAAVARSLLSKLVRGGVPASASETAATVPAPRGQHSVIDLARSVYQSRKRRADHFGPALFSEPAWDMLLVLFIYGDRGDKLSVTKLAESSRSPLTTAIRWLDYLECQRLIVREQCNHDRRKFHVAMSAKGRDLMTAYFEDLLNTIAPV